MKIILPILLALVGLGAGVGAGLALKPDPAETEEYADACAAVADEHGGETGHAESAAAEAECAPEKEDPFAKTAKTDDGHGKATSEMAYVPIEKPFIVPVFADEKVSSMVVVSLAVETDGGGAELVSAVEPRLRDRFLEVMFLHANTGGFDGSFTSGRRMMDLKSALLKAAQDILSDTPVSDVLITEIARQDV